MLIDYLHDDPRTLAACALVCRSWAYNSRYHLFRDVEIQPHHIGRFWDLLRFDPFFLRAVKKLALTPQPARVASPNRTYVPPPSFVDTGRFSLRNSFVQMVANAAKPIFLNVVQLDLSCLEFEDPRVFFAFLSKFPELENLYLNEIQFGAMGDLKVNPPYSSSLVSLRLGKGTNTILPILGYLQNPSSRALLQRLSIHLLSDVYCEILAGFCQTFGEHMTEIELLTEDDVLDRRWTGINTGMWHYKSNPSSPGLASSKDATLLA